VRIDEFSRRSFARVRDVTLELTMTAACNANPDIVEPIQKREYDDSMQFSFSHLSPTSLDPIK